MSEDGWNGYNAAALGMHGLTRGAEVLRFASPTLQEDKTLVCFLVWSNPINLCWASPALQGDADVVAAALSSPFYAEPPPAYPASCVLRYVGDAIRADKDTVLAALARSGYEFQFASETLRADAYVAAWAGAPVGSFSSRGLSKTFMRTLKAGVTVEHVDAFWQSIVQDDDCKRFMGKDYLDYLGNWSKIPANTDDRETLLQWRKNHGFGIGSRGGLFKEDVCAVLKTSFDARCPLCLRVAPAARELLWPTREEWDGVF